MPMYEYRCNKCGEIFEELVSSDDEKVPCPKCGSTMFRKGSKLYCAKEGCGYEMPVPKKD